MMRECPLGLTDREQLARLGPDEYARFLHWMWGQTVAVCDGRSYNYETGDYEPTACSLHPHGAVVYEHDLDRFVRGYPVVD